MVHNFSAGPAMLPAAVLSDVKSELLDYRGMGVSVMEMSHRSEAFIELAERAESDLRDLLAIPENYQVLFLQGGATLQFSSIPLNLSAPEDSVGYVNTGQWSMKAIAEAKRYATAHTVASAENQSFNHVPSRETWDLSGTEKYIHTTHNETINGLRFAEVPDVGDIPLVSDMSSCILSEPLDISRFGLIYAGAQKNIGPAGLTIVIVREDLLGSARESCPHSMNYQVLANAKSMLNTPPTFAWYIAGKVFASLKSQGGLASIKQRNEKKAALLYETIDQSDFYHNAVALENRSLMNVPFILSQPDLESRFLSEAKDAGLIELKGHRSVGGMRASLYNAMPYEGVVALTDYMREFERQYG